MKRISNGQFGNLILAATKHGDEFDEGTTQNMSPIVKNALLTQKKNDTARIEEEILEALDHVRLAKAEVVNEIRAHRKAAEAKKSILVKLEKAEAYGVKTGDFRPMLVLLGASISGYTIPAEWR